MGVSAWHRTSVYRVETHQYQSCTHQFEISEPLPTDLGTVDIRQLFDWCKDG